MKKKRVFVVLACLCALLVFVHACIFTMIGMRDTHNNADVLVVFGNTVYPDGTLSPRLKGRLDTALSLYQQHFAPHIIVSGAVGKEGIDEAAAMKQYLLQNGVPEIDITQDSSGYTTHATAQNTRRIMEERNWKSVISVSQFFHVPRITYTFKQLGVENAYHAHSNYYEPRDAYALFREIVAFYKYMLVVR